MRAGPTRAARFMSIVLWLKLRALFGTPIPSRRFTTVCPITVCGMNHGIVEERLYRALQSRRRANLTAQQSCVSIVHNFTLSLVKYSTCLPSHLQYGVPPPA